MQMQGLPEGPIQFDIFLKTQRLENCSFVGVRCLVRVSVLVREVWPVLNLSKGVLVLAKQGLAQGTQ